MKIAKTLVAVLLGLFLIAGAAGHFFSPEISDEMIPELFPKGLVHIVVGIVELVLGIGALIPRYRRAALRGILLLMILFLPIHLYDAVLEQPVIGSHTVAYVRIAVQFLLIFLAWWAQSGSER